MSPLPQIVTYRDLLRWVVTHPNQAFDPGMVVNVKHATDWEWQAVANQMEELARQTYLKKIKQDVSGTSFWQITPRGENYLRALESVESSVAQNVSVESQAALKSSPATTTDMQGGRIIPPVISKAFGMPTVPVSATSKLTFTIVKRNPNSRPTGVGFTDVLPTGLVISGPRTSRFVGEKGDSPPSPVVTASFCPKPRYKLTVFAVFKWTSRLPVLGR